MSTHDPTLAREAAALRGRRSLMFAVAAPVLGGLVGLGFYFTVGCATGACLLTSTWWSSMLYGAVMGQLLKTTWSS